MRIVHRIQRVGAGVIPADRDATPPFVFFSFFYFVFIVESAHNGQLAVSSFQAIGPDVKQHPDVEDVHQEHPNIHTGLPPVDNPVDNPVISLSKFVVVTNFTVKHLLIHSPHLTAAVSGVGMLRSFVELRSVVHQTGLARSTLMNSKGAKAPLHCQSFSCSGSGKPREYLATCFMLIIYLQSSQAVLESTTRTK